MTEPLTAEDLTALRAITTPTVCNAIETFDLRLRNEGFMDSTIACRFPELGAMIGYAVTLTIRANVPPEREIAPPDVWVDMDKISKPWIVVVDDLDYPRPVGYIGARSTPVSTKLSEPSAPSRTAASATSPKSAPPASTSSRPAFWPPTPMSTFSKWARQSPSADSPSTQAIFSTATSTV